MGLKRKLRIAGIGLAAGLYAGATEANAQQDSAKTQPNRILSRCPEYSVSGEGVLLKDFVFNEAGSSDNLGKILSCLYAQRGNLSYDTVKTGRGLENSLSFLRKGAQIPEKRASIEYLQGLSKAISEKDTYMLIARSPSLKGYDAQSVGILVYTGRVETERPDTTKTEKHKPLEARLTFDAFYGEDNIRGGALGFGYGLVGFSVNYAQRSDKLIEEVTVPLSPNRIGTGKKEELDTKSLGIAAEIHPWRFLFAGGGANVWSYTTRVQENILTANGDPVKPKTPLSRADTEKSGRFFAGVQVHPIKPLGLRGIVGYDTRTGFLGGIGVSVRPHRKQDRR